MDKLLQPDTGLMFWTILTFLTMVFLLSKFAWGPLLHSIEERERRMREDREGAEKARAEAERIQKDLELKLAGLEARTRETMAQAQKEADALRALPASPDALSRLRPSPFPWPVYSAGLLLMVFALWRAACFTPRHRAR